MPQMAWLFSTAHVIRFERNFETKPTRQKNRKISKEIFKFEKGRMDSGNARAWIASGESQPVQAGVIERGTAAQGVPVRQKRVAELDDDVAVRSSRQLEETKRDWRFQNFFGDFGTKITRARTQLCVATLASYL